MVFYAQVTENSPTVNANLSFQTFFVNHSFLFPTLFPGLMYEIPGLDTNQSINICCYISLV